MLIKNFDNWPQIFVISSTLLMAYIDYKGNFQNIKLCLILRAETTMPFTNNLKTVKWSKEMCFLAKISHFSENSDMVNMSVVAGRGFIHQEVTSSCVT